MSRVKVAQVDEIQENRPKIVEVNDRRIALFKLDGSIYAIDNTCPHSGGPLGEGALEGSLVTCPWHAWQFDVKTGACVTVPQDRICSYRVKIEGEEVWLDTDS